MGTGHGHGNHAKYSGYLKRVYVLCYVRKIDIGTEFFQQTTI